TITGAGPVPITFATTEAVTINGQGGGGSLTYTSPANLGDGSSLTFTPGATVDSGTITGHSDLFAAPHPTLAPLTYTDLGSFDQTVVVFATANPIRTDRLLINGTSSGDFFDVSGANGGTVRISSQFADTTLMLRTPGVKLLNLNGLGGVNNFLLETFLGPLPW